MFERAHAVAPSARTVGQMGLVETALQRWVDAESHLLASLSSADDAWVKKNRGFLEQALGQRPSRTSASSSSPGRPGTRCRSTAGGRGASVGAAGSLG